MNWCKRALECHNLAIILFATMKTFQFSFISLQPLSSIISCPWIYALITRRCPVSVLFATPLYDSTASSSVVLWASSRALLIHKVLAICTAEPTRRGELYWAQRAERLPRVFIIVSIPPPTITHPYSHPQGPGIISGYVKSSWPWQGLSIGLPVQCLLYLHFIMRLHLILLTDALLKRFSMLGSRSVNMVWEKIKLSPNMTSRFPVTRSQKWCFVLRLSKSKLCLPHTYFLPVMRDIKWIFLSIYITQYVRLNVC